MSFTLTPNMFLPVPGVGTESGPQYATDINNCLTILDQHSHSAGSGVQITPSGLNINSSLTMNNQSLIAIGALTFTAVLTDAVSNSLYEKGVDLYYRDGSGNVIRITQSGSVSGASGTITGLPSGTASASFGAGTFVFQASTATGANIDGASYIFRNNTAGSAGLTLQPPNAMGADYSLTLPSLPASTKILTLDTAGNIAANYDVDNSTLVVSSNTIQVATQGIQQGNLALRPNGSAGSANAGEIGHSLSCGSFTTSAGSFVTISNFSVSIATLGRPVRLFLTSDTSGNPMTVVPSSSATFRWIRDSGEIARFNLFVSGSGPYSFEFLDSVAAGTHTYSLQVNSSNTSVQFASICFYEI